MSAYTKSQTGANRAFPDFSFVKSLHISFSQHIHYCYNFYWNLLCYSRSFFAKADHWFERACLFMGWFLVLPHGTNRGTFWKRPWQRPEWLFWHFQRVPLSNMINLCTSPFEAFFLSCASGRVVSHTASEVGHWGAECSWRPRRKQRAWFEQRSCCGAASGRCRWSLTPRRVSSCGGAISSLSVPNSCIVQQSKANWKYRL